MKPEITEPSLPQHGNDALHTSACWGTVAVKKLVTDIEISSTESILVSLRNSPTKGLYMYMPAFDCLFPCDDHDLRLWCDILNFEVDRKYTFMKNECDLIWKIMHGAIPTCRFLNG